MMDNWCAPQWTDFTCSPQLASDSYFEMEHEVHEPQIQLKSNLKSELSLSCKKQITKESSVTETNFDDSLESVQDTCTNIAYFIPHNNTKVSEKQTKNDRSLNKAMKSLKLDEKSVESHCAWNVSITELTSGCKAPTEPCKLKTVAYEKNRKHVRMLETKNIILGKSSKNNEVINCIKEKNNAQITVTKDKDKSIVKSEIDDCSKFTKVGYTKKRLSYEVVSARRRQSNVFKLKRSQPKVLAYQYRRRSLMKYRRCSNQFISMAEAVSKFQNGTPQRFRTISNKDLKPGPLIKLKRSPLKLTHPLSPALRSKQRARRTNVLSQQERELLELEEMKKHQIKANPVPLNILKGPSVLKKVPKKPITVTEEFRLTQPKKTRHTTDPQANTQRAADDKKQSHKNAVPMARSISASNVATKKEDNTCTKYSVDSNIKPTMNILPFNFEARNKEFQMKKEEKLKNLQVQETNKIKAEFHARPAPKFSKPANPVKEQSLKKRTIVSCPFSFAERDKSLAKKKESLVKQIQEGDKKIRTFHANPVPSFKPVMVHGLSKENLRSKEKTVNTSKEVIPRQTKSCYDQENKQPNIILNTAVNEKKKKVKQHIVNNESEKKQSKSVPNVVDEKNEKAKVNQRKSIMPKFELNTDKRAKERNEFDEKIRKREQQQEAKRQEEEKIRLQQEKLEKAELRRLAEVKATPMPVYKPLIILKSNKQPTTPRSPAWGSKSKSKSTS